MFLPRPLYFVESLPRNATGKLPREVLLRFAADCGRRKASGEPGQEPGLSQDWLQAARAGQCRESATSGPGCAAAGKAWPDGCCFSRCALYFLIFSVRARAASQEVSAQACSAVRQDWPTCSATTSASPPSRWIAYTCCAAASSSSRSGYSGEEVLVEAQARGETCFLLGAHLGSFEALHAYGEENGIRVTMMMFEHGSRNMNALARAINPDLERTVIGMGSLDSMIKLQRAARIRRVGGHARRPRLCSKAVMSSVPFLGEPAAFPTAPFRIAAMFERPVVLMLALYRGGNRYDLHFERLVEIPRLTATARVITRRAGRDAAIRGWAARYAERLEHYCRQAPYNWFNFYDFWDRGGPSRLNACWCYLRSSWRCAQACRPPRGNPDRNRTARAGACRSSCANWARSSARRRASSSANTSKS